MNQTETGAWAENLAWQHIQQQGWQLVVRNFFCKGGEIDIIAHKGGILAFIEVKYRRSQAMGGAVASLTTTKQRHLIHSANVFLQRHAHLNRLDCRFDLIAISGPNPKDDGSPNQVQIQWIDNAFITSG